MTRRHTIGALLLALAGCGGPETTDTTTGPGLATLDGGPATSGTTEADDTMGMRLDVPVTTGVDDGQTTGECVSQSLEPDLQGEGQSIQQALGGVAPLDGMCPAGRAWHSCVARACPLR